MKLTSDIEYRIQQYLDEVKSNLKGYPADEQQDILEGLEAHIHDALATRSEEAPDIHILEAVLAEMDSPSSYRRISDAAVPRESNRRRYFVPAVILSGVVCCLIGFLLHDLFPPNPQPSAKPEPTPLAEPEETVEIQHPTSPINEAVQAPFINDPRVLGKWISVDFVADPAVFNPQEKTWQGDLYLRELTFLPDGKMNQPWITWTSNQVFHSGDKTISHYSIKTMDSQDYLFFEWMSGDVTIRGQKPNYYVLKRDIPEDAASTANMSESVLPMKLVSTPIENCAWLAAEYIPPDFATFFPNNPEGGKMLDDLFDQRNNLSIPDEEVLSIVRNGLRTTKHNKSHVIRWIGNRYIWGKSPQHPIAVEILYQAAQPDDAYGTRHYAVYFGLSVLTNKTPNVLQTLANNCLIGAEAGRTLWGLGKNKEALRPYLEPYLSDTNSSKHDMALALNKAIDGRLDIQQWLQQQNQEQALEKYGDQLPEISEELLTGSSAVRFTALKFLLKNYALAQSMDESYLEAWKACATDPDARVRNEVARIVGGQYIWRAPNPNPDAVDLIYTLSYDTDQEVRYNCVYHGLSTLRDKSDRIIKRLIEIWFTSPFDQNLHGRIEWGLRSPQSQRQLEELLEPCLNADDPEVRAQALQMYCMVLSRNPPEIERFADVGQYKCAFQAVNSEDHIKSLQQALPKYIQIEQTETLTNKGQSYGRFEFTGLPTREALLVFFKDNHDFRAHALLPTSPPVVDWVYPELEQQ